jgi:hypothetical protein
LRCTKTLRGSAAFRAGGGGENTLNPHVVEKLRAYCEFLDCSSQHHVVEQLLEFAFRSDGDFQAWLERHGTTRKKDGATAKPAAQEASS